ncbi:hypothetical protein PR048_004635, partial [Dryococelus australis]
MFNESRQKKKTIFFSQESSFVLGFNICISVIFFLSAVFFTDETGIVKDAIVKFHNTDHWDDQNPLVIRQSRYQHQFSIHVLAGILPILHAQSTAMTVHSERSWRPRRQTLNSGCRRPGNVSGKREQNRGSRGAINLPSSRETRVISLKRDQKTVVNRTQDGRARNQAWAISSRLQGSTISSTQASDVTTCRSLLVANRAGIFGKEEEGWIGESEFRDCGHQLAPPTKEGRATAIIIFELIFSPAPHSPPRTSPHLHESGLDLSPPATFPFSHEQVAPSPHQSEFYPAGQSRRDDASCPAGGESGLMPGCTNIFPDPISNDPSSEPGSRLILVS